MSDVHGCLGAFAERVAQLGALGFFDEGCEDEQIRSRHADVVRWMRGLREYHETDRQVFVHAGIDESQGGGRTPATPRSTILWDRAYRRGPFYKDVVAGHTAASTVAPRRLLGRRVALLHRRHDHTIGRRARVGIRLRGHPLPRAGC